MKRTLASLVAAALTGAVAAAVLILALTARLQPYTPAASMTRITPPNPQVIDGLYKSVVYKLDGQTFICILTQLPQSFPHFTIPPGYSCSRAAGSP